MALWLVVASLGLAACASQPRLGARSEPDTEPTTARQRLGFDQFPDIPIPAGAAMDLERSLVLGSADEWTGRLAMTVRDSTDALYDFYHREMQKFGWQEVTTVRSEISVLTFSRGDRVATVQIRSTTLSGALIDLTVSPRRHPVAPRSTVGSRPR